MTKAKTKAGSNIAARDFTDAGTGRSFKQGETVDATAGELENYRAAGLLDGEAAEAAAGDANTTTTADTQTA